MAMAPGSSLDPTLSAWTFDPQVALGIALLGGIYVAGLREIARRGRFRRLLGAWPPIAFGCGLLALVVGLLSPLDTYDGQSFAVHMAQHLVLLVVAPPLLLLGRPIPVLLLGVPHPLARGVARVHHRTPWLRVLIGAVVSPVGSWLLLTADLIFWHLPPLYQATLSNQGLHVFEHVTFLIVALLSWWVIVEPLPGPARLHPGLRLLYAWAVMMPMGVLGILLTIANVVWYPAYAAAPRLWGLSALNDQQLGGMLMWVPGGLVYILAMSVLFFRMMSEEAEEGDEPLLERDDGQYTPLAPFSGS
jgi:cytochrome c oxidase assembly factor CtaG